jgi:transcription initiation factor TFIIB
MRQTVRFHEGPISEAHTRGELLVFLRELNAIAHSLKLPREVSKRADSICADAATMSFSRVTVRPVLAAAALYVACREYNQAVTLRELADATGTDPRDVGRCYTTILERMHISRPSLNGKRYVRHLVLREPLSNETFALSEEIVRKATEVGLGGRNPMTLAAAALYLACCSMGDKVTQAEVAEAAGVGEESVRECCKAIRALEKPFGS